MMFWARWPYSVATTPLGGGSMDAATDTTETNERGCVPVKPHFHKQMAGPRAGVSQPLA